MQGNVKGGIYIKRLMGYSQISVGFMGIVKLIPAVQAVDTSSFIIVCLTALIMFCFLLIDDGIRNVGNVGRYR